MSFMVNGNVSVLEHVEDETLMTRITWLESVMAVVLVTSLRVVSVPKIVIQITNNIKCLVQKFTIQNLPTLYVQIIFKH
jgi:hypothetical protein